MTLKQNRNLLPPDPIKFNAKRKGLPKFEPHDLRSIINKARSSADQSGIDEAVVLEIRRRNQRQMLDLLRGLGINPSQPDAYQKGFYWLAFYHHGVGHLAWQRSRTNRNAATWTNGDDLNLLVEVIRLKATGLSELEAIKRIASDRRTNKLFPYREQSHRSGSDFSVQKEPKKRRSALRRRLQRLKVSSTENSILNQLLGPGWNAQSNFERLLYAFDFTPPLAGSAVTNKRSSR
jgi:hypothetical protein